MAQTNVGDDHETDFESDSESITVLPISSSASAPVAWGANRHFRLATTLLIRLPFSFSRYMLGTDVP